MGCNRTPTEKEAQAIQEAASRVVAEVGGGASTARAEQLVATYGEWRAKAILREEQQAWSNSMYSNSFAYSNTTQSYSFEQPSWVAQDVWASQQREADRQRDADTQRQRDADTQRQRDADTQRQRDADTQRQRDADTQRQRDADTQRQERKVNQLHFHYASPGSYQHQTDALGRVVSNEGWLTLAQGESPSTDRTKGKDRGHLIGNQFGGLGDSSNIVDMDPRINRSFINAFEGCIADHVRSGMELYLRVRVEYGESGLASAVHYEIHERDKGWHSTMTIDPNTERAYTLGAATKKAGWTVRDFVDPFRQPDGDQYDA